MEIDGTTVICILQYPIDENLGHIARRLFKGTKLLPQFVLSMSTRQKSLMRTTVRNSFREHGQTRQSHNNNYACLHCTVWIGEVTTDLVIKTWLWIYWHGTDVRTSQPYGHNVFIKLLQITKAFRETGVCKLARRLILLQLSISGLVVDYLLKSHLILRKFRNYDSLCLSLIGSR